MKTPFVAALAALSLLSFADTPPAPAPVAPHTGGAVTGRPRRTRPVVDRGGFLDRKTDGGVVRFIDMRGGDATDISGLVANVASAADVAAETVRAERREGAKTLETAKAALAEKGVAVAVVVCDDGTDSPTLTVCPEDRMAVVNAGKLKDGNPAVFERRLKNEMLRALGFVLGGYASIHPCVMKPVYKVSDLDALPPVFSPPVRGFMEEGATAWKVARVERIPYATAVRQGWAPAPTNDVQKAIWAEFHSATNAPAAK